MNSGELGQLSMLELFRQEAQTQVQILSDGLLVLEHAPRDTGWLEACMRAAHSIKGAARIIGLEAAVDVAHALEDCFVAAREQRLTLDGQQIDALLRGADLLLRIAEPPGADPACAEQAGRSEVEAFLSLLQASLQQPPGGPQTMVLPPLQPPPASTPAPAQGRSPDRPDAEAQRLPAQAERTLRVGADHLNRLLFLSGESLVESRRLQAFAGSLLRIRRTQLGAGRSLDRLHEHLAVSKLDEPARAALEEARRQLADCQRMLADQLAGLETFDRRFANLSQRLFDEALACRMRPFADGTAAYARMVRDLGRSLGKEVRLEIVGDNTEIDRDILEQLEAPLGHMLRNAVDHGIETPQARRAAGKPEQGRIILQARHSAGMLQITVADDGAGVDLARLADTIVRRKLAAPDTVARMSEPELLEFLLLPNFTTRSSVTEISGRGVGLDVVADMVRQVRGTIRILTEAGRGTRLQLQLPLTRSVMRSLLVAIGGQPYAFPLAYVNRTLELRREQIDMSEGHQHFAFGEHRLGLVMANQVLQCGTPMPAGDTVPVVVIGERDKAYGLAVDRFLGEGMLVVQPLDPRLGKIKDIAAGALLEDGSPVLIVDVDDMLRSVENLVRAGRLERVSQAGQTVVARRGKRILVVDDSLTVRELERKLLGNRGYEVEVAVDGMDGWNTLRSASYDLLLTDIDMPRMDGIELVTLVRRDPRLKSLPVMIVSYKDREEDRQRGLEAGADHYFAKGSFDDAGLLQAVRDLIGEAQG
jgi:two-component system sensor histidine kinase and response regulator WspE